MTDKITIEDLLKALQEMNEFLKQLDNDMNGITSRIIELEMRMQEDGK